jgi:galactokinase
VLRAHSVAYGETRELSLAARSRPRTPDWTSYIAGVAWSLANAGHDLSGLDLVVDADLPIGAGLSSSAALEVATARALADAAGLAWNPVAMAQLCRTAENNFVGVSCGLMDQYASAASVEGCALLLDCRSAEAVPVGIPESAAIVVMDTGARRELVSSAYNDRLAACQAALQTLRGLYPNLRTLRDVTAQQLEAARGRLDPLLHRRAQHVVAEIERPVAMAAALERGDLDAAGRLMDESHASLRDLYEVSSPELELACRLARAHPACFGARMTGAGFGGCAVALVARAGADAFAGEVEAAYRAESRLPGVFLLSRPEAGARLFD